MLNVTKVDLWSNAIDHQPGGLMTKLEALVKAGADLDLILARGPAAPAGKGAVLLSPITGQRQQQAAEQAGFQRNSGLYCLRLAGMDEPGYAYRLLFTLAGEGLNVHELAAVTLEGQFVMYVAFDTAADADKAMNRLQRPL